MRRREKKVTSDQIRERKIVQKEEKLRQEIPPKKTFSIRIWVRLKWNKAPDTEGMTWSKYRRYLKRTFKLKQWRWRFDESVGEKGWCQKLQNPFSVDHERRYRIVLQEKLSRRPRLGKPKLNRSKEQRMRPNSRGAHQAPADTFTWSPPPADISAPRDTAPTKPPPAPRSGV
jgi:hypothetical protein